MNRKLRTWALQGLGPIPLSLMLVTQQHGWNLLHQALVNSRVAVPI